MSNVVDEINYERARQVAVEGWTREHDDEHANGDMARAAACYALRAGQSPNDHRHGAGYPPPYWPWAPRWWKPKDPRRDLIRAAALIVAEIERIDRAALPHQEERKDASQ